MAHAHGEKTVASQMKSSVNVGPVKMMDSPMGKMGMGTMMNEGMAKVMKTPKTPLVVGSGAASAAAACTGKSVMGKFFTNPLLLFSIGVAAGNYIHKYRKSIISISNEAQQEE
ncbi:MAG: hypothetical protein PHO08_16320 [Methylococcales bacterium]|nr:hypothetical protein [Methylococcales bacterium]MDD5632960.1 hypothetical protein [Methylococcales bacterium]